MKNTIAYVSALNSYVSKCENVNYIFELYKDSQNLGDIASSLLENKNLSVTNIETLYEIYMNKFYETEKYNNGAFFISLLKNKNLTNKVKEKVYPLVKKLKNSRTYLFHYSNNNPLKEHCYEMLEIDYDFCVDCLASINLKQKDVLFLMSKYEDERTFEIAITNSNLSPEVLFTLLDLVINSDKWNEDDKTDKISCLLRNPNCNYDIIKTAISFVNKNENKIESITMHRFEESLFSHNDNAVIDYVIEKGDCVDVKSFLTILLPKLNLEQLEKIINNCNDFYVCFHSFRYIFEHAEKFDVNPEKFFKL